MSFPFQQCRIEPISNALSLPVRIDVLRLDLVHPVVSGNKAFKLKEYISAANAEGKTTLLTFGGAYSNHIVATAATAKMVGLKSIGIIRGEEPKSWSHTLLAAKSNGMDLHFVSRDDYRHKHIPSSVYGAFDAEAIYTVPEGGYGLLGMKGAMDILTQNDTLAYTHILAAVGTGTTVAGLIAAAASHQKIIGVPVLKNAVSLKQEIENLLPVKTARPFDLMTDYHFGGYAKHTPTLFAFMNHFYEATAIPTDFVYTGKAFFAAMKLVRNEYFPRDSKLLLVHTGGLQGNASLKKGALMFE